MKVCGFSFVRNGIKFDYPFEEAIRSILPLCDKVVVAVGHSEDNTLERVKSIDPKIEILETTWNESLREGGRILANETDKAFQKISTDFDWAVYIQGDEVIHEQYVPVIKKAMHDYLDDKKTDGLLFNYLHFFGSYDFVSPPHSWYRREIRIIRNNKEFFSYKDAQGFRKKPMNKLNVRLIDAYVYHYGWVREPVAMQKKTTTIFRYYNNKSDSVNDSNNDNAFEYDKMRKPVRKFTGTHPKVMTQRIERKNWAFHPDLTMKDASLKDKFKRLMLRFTGWIPGEYRNYKMI